MENGEWRITTVNVYPILFSILYFLFSIGVVPLSTSKPFNLLYQFF